MAPRRGGGSGGSRSGGGIPQCSSSAFERDASMVHIGFYGLFIVVYAILLCIAGFKLLRSKQKGKALRRWWALGVTIIFATLGVILDTVSFALQECQIDGYVEIVISAFWFNGFSTFLLIAIIMVPLCRGVLRAAGKATKLVTIVHVSYLAVLAVVYIAGIGIDTYSYLTIFGSRSMQHILSSDSFKTLSDHQLKLWTAVVTLKAFAAFMAAAVTVFAFLRGSNVQSRKLKIFVALAIISTLAMTLTQLGNYTHQNYGDFKNIVSRIELAKRETFSLVAHFLHHFFFACAFLFALFAGSAVDHFSGGDSDAATHFAGYPTAYEGAQESKYDSIPPPQSYQPNQAPYPSYQQYPQPPPQYQQPPQATYP